MVDKIEEAAVGFCRGEKVSAEFSEQNKDFSGRNFLLNIEFLHFLFGMLMLEVLVIGKQDSVT